MNVNTHALSLRKLAAIETDVWKRAAMTDAAREIDHLCAERDDFEQLLRVVGQCAHASGKDAVDMAMEGRRQRLAALNSTVIDR